MGGGGAQIGGARYKLQATIKFKTVSYSFEDVYFFDAVFLDNFGHTRGDVDTPPTLE
jgi:hypothetical protein